MSASAHQSNGSFSLLSPYAITVTAPCKVCGMLDLLMQTWQKKTPNKQTTK